MNGWVEPVCSVLTSLVSNGRVTIRRNTLRWRRVLPGFRALNRCMALHPVLCCDDGPVKPCTAASQPRLVEHAAKLRTIVSVAVASATEAGKTSWSYTMQGSSWDIVIFRYIVHSLATVIQDRPAEPGPKRQRLAAATDASRQTAPPPDTSDPGAGITAPVSERLAADSGLAALPCEAQQQQPPSACMMPDLERSCLPPLPPDLAQVPPTLVALMQISLLLRVPGTECRQFSVDDDGNIELEVSCSKTLHPPVASDVFSVVASSHTLRFPGMFSEDAVAASVAAMCSLDTGEDTPLATRWKQLLLSRNLLVSMWLPFPPDFVDTEAMRQCMAMPCPAGLDPKLIPYHPMTRWHDDFWASGAASVLAQPSKGFVLAIRNGAAAALDLAAWCTVIAALIDSDHSALAVRVARVLSSCAERRLACPHAKERLLLGGMSVLINLIPTLAVTSVLQTYQVRALRKSGQYQAAAQLIDEIKQRDVHAEPAVFQLATSQVSAAESMLAGDPAAAASMSLHAHRDFVHRLREDGKLGWLWVNSEMFALMRLQGKPAREIYQLAQRVWHPGTDVINWKISPSYDDVPPNNLASDHLFATFPSSQYARAMASAADAQEEHIKDALVKAKAAFRARRDVLGPRAPATLKTMDALLCLFEAYNAPDHGLS